MATKFIIPSVFTVVDGLSGPMDKMRHNVSAFGTRSEVAVARAERAFRSLTPGLGAVQKQLLGIVSAGTLVAGAFQLGNFSFSAVTGYEEAVDSFHTIVSDLNDSQFTKFQNTIDTVAHDAKRSSVDVAKSFEKIAGLNASFAETASGLGEVSKASIILSKAAKMDLGVAAENLVGIMNQFSFGANEANRTINALAAGQAVGAANITQTAEAFVNFGAVAAGANITLEESVGLVQTLGKFSLFSADAGTALKGAIVRLQKAGLGYKSGQFDIIDALEQTNRGLSKLKTAKEKDAALNKIFGAQQIVAGRILTSNVDLVKKFTEQVSGTSEAQKAASINSGNLNAALGELSGEWVNQLTGSGNAKQAITEVTSVVQNLTANLGDIISTGLSVGKVVVRLGAGLLLLKAYLVATAAATTAINVGIGIYNALFTRSVVLTYANATAQKAYMITSVAMGHVLEILSGNFAALNAAMLANPVGAVLLGVAALAAGLLYLAYSNKKAREEYERGLNNRVEAAQNAEIERLNKLIDANVRLGKSRKEAAAAAIQAERMDIGIQMTRNQAQIDELKARLAEKQVILKTQGGGQFKFDLPGAQSIHKELLPKMQQQTMLKERSLALTNFAIGKTREAAPTASQSFTEKDKFSGGELANMMTKGGAEGESVKGDISIKIDNNSDSPVQVSSGKTRPMDVMPRTSSTKQLRSQYGK